MKLKSNLADLITRLQSADNLDKGMWLRGPQFLSVHKCYWESGEELSCELSPNDPEVCKNFASLTISVVLAQSDQDRFHSGIIDRVVTHYSSWFKMERVSAWLVCYTAFLRGSRDDSRLLVGHVKTAEQILIRDSQRKMFPDDIHDLSIDKPVKYTVVCVRSTRLLTSMAVFVLVGESKNPWLIINTHILSMLSMRYWRQLFMTHTIMVILGWSGHLALSENTSGWSKQDH